ncbi:hypothetical protein BD309DRAFT_977994 [Dichomitus squalens]|nr:hypothetical protein BD309DRAFT_977994 [Dichomitus squalens]
MQSHFTKRSLPSPRELDAKLELLQELGYVDRFYLEDDDTHTGNPVFLDNADRWVETEYEWALEEAAEPIAGVPDFFDAEEDEEACLPCVYDPTFFAGRQPMASATRSRSQSLSQPLRTGSDKYGLIGGGTCLSGARRDVLASDKAEITDWGLARLRRLPTFDSPLPSIPPLRLRNRPSLPIVPPSSPVQMSALSSPGNSPSIPIGVTRGEIRQTPPSSPRLAGSPRSRTFPRSHGSPPATRPAAHRHATFPSISSTLSLLEERESEADKRSAVYVHDGDPQPLPQSATKSVGRGRSSSATIASGGRLSSSFPISSSPRRKQRPALPALSTSASSPQLRRLAELASTPSPSFSACSPLLPSLMSDTPQSDDMVSPGEAITSPPLESPEEATVEPGLASRWSLDSVASRPRITQMALDDGSASPASKTRKRDRLLSLISGRTRSGSVTKPLPPPNTPRASSDVVDIYRIDARDALSPIVSSPSRSTFPMPPRIQQAPSLSSTDSSNTSSASNLATPVEPVYPGSSDPFAMDSPSCMPEYLEEEEGSPVFADNPYFAPESPLLLPESPVSSVPPLPLSPPGPLRLHIDDDLPMSPSSPPPQPTLPLPSPSTPSPSFLVPSPRPQSFFATITGRQKRRKKKLVISGAPLEIGQPRASSSVSPTQSSDDLQHRQQEQQRRMQNVVKWCESFGPLRKIETKEDGSLHVYWKDWEVADRVCRIQAQVVIKDVGRVSLAWSYIS